MKCWILFGLVSKLSLQHGTMESAVAAVMTTWGTAHSFVYSHLALSIQTPDGVLNLCEVSDHLLFHLRWKRRSGEILLGKLCKDIYFP